MGKREAGATVSSRERYSAHDAVPRLTVEALRAAMASFPPGSLPSPPLPIDTFTASLFASEGLRLHGGGAPACPFRRMRRLLLSAVGEAESYVATVAAAGAVHSEAKRLKVAMMKIATCVEAFGTAARDAERFDFARSTSSAETLAPLVEGLQRWADHFETEAVHFRPKRADFEAWRVGFVLGLGRALRDVSDRSVSRVGHGAGSFRDLLDAAFETVLRLADPATQEEVKRPEINWERAISAAQDIARSTPEVAPGLSWWDGLREWEIGMTDDELDRKVYDIDDEGRQMEAAPLIPLRQRRRKEWKIEMRQLHRKATAGDARAADNLADQRELANLRADADALAFLDSLATEGA